MIQVQREGFRKNLGSLIIHHLAKAVRRLGIKDTATTKYMRQNEIFADAFNYFVYNGEQVIKPDSLEELDTRQVEVPYGGVEGAEQPIQKTRDVIKSLTAMTDKKTAYLLLAIENQSNIHYALPIKNGIYDMLSYARQIENAVVSHKLSGDYKGSSSDEFLSGFMKNDRLIPVVTLTIYFDSKNWDAPMSIHEMLESQDARVLALVPDHKINLIMPASIEDNDFEKFNTSLKEVLSFIKYSADKNKLGELLESREGFHHLGRNEIDVLNACVGAKLTIKQGKEVLDVCIAIEEMKKEAANIAANKERTIILISNIKNLMDSMGWSAEQSMDMLKIPENDRLKLLEHLN
jgi:hypothetical protein